MIERSLENTLERQLRTLIDQGRTQGQEQARRQARLAGIIQEFNELGCPLHGSDKCPSVSACLAKEIVERKVAWE